MVARGTLGTASSNGYYLDDISPVYLAPGYYIFHAWVASGTYGYGTAAKTYPELAFLSSSSKTTSANAQPGTYQIRFTFAP